MFSALAIPPQLFVQEKDKFPDQLVTPALNYLTSITLSLPVFGFSEWG